MKYLISTICWIVFVILVIGTIFGLLLYSMIKMCVFLIIVLLIDFIFNNSKSTLRHVARNDHPEINYFKIYNFLKFVLIWLIYFLILSCGTRYISCYKGYAWVINLGPHWFIDPFTLFIQLMLSITHTDNGYVRFVENYFDGKIKMIFPAGLMMYPGIWFFYKISEPLRPEFKSDGTVIFIKMSQERFVENLQDKSKINIDTGMIRTRTNVSRIEDFLYTFLWNNKNLNFHFDFDYRKILISVFLTVLISIGSFQLKNYIDENYFNVSKTEQNNSENSDSNSRQKISNEWYPNQKFNPSVSYDCNSIRHDPNITNCLKLERGQNSVKISGQFFKALFGKVPRVYVFVDGYIQNEDLSFEDFFEVYIYKLNFKNGAIVTNVLTTLKSYNKAIEKKCFDSDCYRDIEIRLKKRFSNKLSWTILDTSNNQMEMYPN